MNINRLSIFFLHMLLITSSITIHARLVDITSAEQYKQIISQSQPTIVKFGADWCGVCQGIKKPFKKIAQEKEFDNVNFADVDIDNLKDLSKQYDVGGVPTFVYIQNGKQLNQEVGVENMVTFEDDLRNNVRTTFKLAENNISKIESDDSTPGQIEQDENPVQPTENKQESKPTQGILGMVKNFFVKIIELIKNAIKYVVDKITGLFR